MNWQGRQLLLGSVVQPGQQLLHLYRRETAGKWRHQALSLQQDATNLIVRGRSSAGEGLVRKNMMQAGGNLPEAKIVLFVAVCAATVVQVLAGSLVLGKRWRGFFASYREHGRQCKDGCC